MQKQIVSSWKDFSELFSDLVSREPVSPRINSLKRYFAQRGVISVIMREKGWPELFYPDPMRLNSLIKEKESLLKNLEGKNSEWKETNSEAKNYFLKQSVKKFSNPLYWKHVKKTLTDKDYKQMSDKAGLPVDLVSDPKWKPMIEMFVNNPEYRQQLVQTMEESVVYSKDKKLAKHAQNVVDLRTDISSKKVQDLTSKILELKSNLEMYHELLKWAKSR